MENRLNQVANSFKEIAKTKQTTRANKIAQLSSNLKKMEAENPNTLRLMDGRLVEYSKLSAGGTVFIHEGVGVPAKKGLEPGIHEVDTDSGTPGQPVKIFVVKPGVIQKIQGLNGEAGVSVLPKSGTY